MMLDEVLPYFVFFIITCVAVALGIYVTVKARRFLKIFGILIVSGGFLFCCVSWFFGTDIYQEFKLRYFSGALNRLSHPPGTAYLDSILSMPHTGSNYCHYFVGSLRSYSGDQQEIAEFYHRQRMPMALREGSLYVAFINGCELAPTYRVYGPDRRASYEDVVREGANEIWESPSPVWSELQGYIIYYLDDSEHYFDYRCH